MKTRLTIGIDPGLTGSVAILDADGMLQALADTPTLSVKVKRGTRHVYDAPGLVALLQPYASLHSHVVIEESQAMPGQGGSAFTGVLRVPPAEMSRKRVEATVAKISLSDSGECYG